MPNDRNKEIWNLFKENVLFKKGDTASNMQKKAETILQKLKDAETTLEEQPSKKLHNDIRKQIIEDFNNWINSANQSNLSTFEKKQLIKSHQEISKLLKEYKENTKHLKNVHVASNLVIALRRITAS